jgi:hypothetical protein
MAFLLQAFASATVGLVLLDPLVIPGNIVETMIKFSGNVLQVRASFVGEMVTVIALIVLSALLYIALKKENKKIVLVALGLRLTEVALLAVSRVATFGLLWTSQAFIAEGQPAYLQTVGQLFNELQGFIYSLNMIFFCLGGTLFYVAIYRSRFVPQALALVGLVAAPLALIGTVVELFGLTVPLIVFLPNLPFELAIGLWLVVKGARNGLESSG